MKFLALLLLICASFASPAYAREMRADARYGVQYTQERVAELPQDENRPYLTVIGSNSDPRFATLKQWFAEHETLAALRARTHFNAVPTESAHYTERLAGSFPATPCVAMQDSQGNVIAEFKPNELPISADALAAGLNRKATYAAECFSVLRRWKGSDEESPVTPDHSSPLPSPVPNRNREVEMWPFLLLGLCTVFAGLGVAKGWHDLYYKK